MISTRAPFFRALLSFVPRVLSLGATATFAFYLWSIVMAWMAGEAMPPLPFSRTVIAYGWAVVGAAEGAFPTRRRAP